MAESGTTSAADGAAKGGSSGAAPAWKLRETLKKKQEKSKRSNSSKFARKSASIDPNLPPAFRQVAMQRLAFDRQQARRKNNDEFVSLNSTHVGKEPTPSELDDMSSFSDDSFGDSFGDEEVIEEEEVLDE
mmetsp:Transcript_133936/g.199191  ORF Transcript_133936/g.199191 Transcript_133936/m.199191 type:complete len:131 (-) Transcript_133936:229-621(-)|eukprot:CAMPEP_0117024174 /NCGR_PEP_ID=MMETSP0472-20121206/17977_1 /TAXON_ID=693140 ORGANISM="Tiarina fusus, Strain LIS" /NCGR_SAMPLE_ID=MMETSP0472 /ASSEMBLY_ACC=CAM_ASM_000603 /LENGTH=130 /DNA_ID=CAMNT_0004730525 /DNA_START=160 /DNA_END=552 /DNA_ORIENTATION=-